MRRRSLMNALSRECCALEAERLSITDEKAPISPSVRFLVVPVPRRLR